MKDAENWFAGSRTEDSAKKQQSMNSRKSYPHTTKNRAYKPSDPTLPSLITTSCLTERKTKPDETSSETLFKMKSLDVHLETIMGTNKIRQKETETNLEENTRMDPDRAATQSEAVIDESGDGTTPHLMTRTTRTIFDHEENSIYRPYLGRSRKKPLQFNYQKVYAKPETSWKISRGIQRQRKLPYSIPSPACSFLTLNGLTYFQDAQSTLIMCFLDYIRSCMTRRPVKNSEPFRSLSDQPHQRDKFVPMVNGSLHGTRPSAQLQLSSLTENENFAHMENTSQEFLLPYQSTSTQGSSNLTKRSASASDSGETWNLQNTGIFQTYTSSGFNPHWPPLETPQTDLITLSNANAILADDGTMDVALTPLPPAPMHTTALSAAPQTIQSQTARDLRKNELHEKWSARPRYTRNLVWADSEHPRVLSVDATLTARPFPDPPLLSPHTRIARQTIASHPDLFKIICPINVDLFEYYLSHHPNRPFVESVCKGLRFGFWPNADTSSPDLPLTWDNSDRYTIEPQHVSTVLNDINSELAAHHYSPNFGPNLLPGMFSMPLFVIPKPNTDKWRVVLDHSAEPFSLNSTIP